MSNSILLGRCPATVADLSTTSYRLCGLYLHPMADMRPHAPLINQYAAVWASSPICLPY